MKCLVTGAAGFVGSTLTDELLRRGHEVVGIDCFLDYYPEPMKRRNLESASRDPKFSLVEDSLLSADLSNLLSGVELVFHQAGQAGVRASWGEYFRTYTDNNVLATHRLLEAATRVSTLRKFVFASSSSVYGDAERFPTSEEVLPSPVSPYGVTKLASEHLATLFCSQFGVQTISLRYFTVYGPRQRPDMAFHRFIRAGLTREELVVYGDGHQVRDFTFISDIVEANILAALSPHTGVFNIGGGNQASVLEVLEVMRRHIPELSVRHQATERGDARRTSADTTKARTLLGFSPQVSLEDGIAAEVQWLRELLQA